MIFKRIAPAAVMSGMLLSPWPSTLHAQTPPPLPSQAQLADELKSLRRELFQDMHERQIERVEALERELEYVRRECQLVDAASVRDERESMEWANELQGSELPAEARAQAEAARREAYGERAEKLREIRTAAVAREAELVQRLTRERARLQRAREVLDALSR